MTLELNQSVNKVCKKNLVNFLFGPYMALIVLLIVCAVSSEHFRDVDYLLKITRQIAYSGIIALGMTYVIAGGGIDLSVGSLLAFSGVLSITAANYFGNETTGFLAGMGTAVIVGLLGGALNGLLVTLGRIPPFIATLGTLSIFRSLALYMTNAGTIGTRNSLYGDFGGSMVCGVPTPTIFLVLLTLLLSIVMTRTRFGRHVWAVGANERVARFAGIGTNGVKFLTYLIIGLMAGISAFLLAGRLSNISSSNAGLSYELDAIAAVIIGGTSLAGGRGYLWGTLAGILILGIVSSVLDIWGISANLQGAVKGLVIIIAVLIQRKEKS